MLEKFIAPVRFKKIYKQYKEKEFSMLDIGCGNHSPSITLRWFPKCDYYGIDKEDYNLSPRDHALMRQYYRLDLERDLGQIETVIQTYFDIIMLSHIIEHLSNGAELINRVVGKMKSGGKIYIEFPSKHALTLPSLPGTLNFCDDATHKRIYTIEEISNILLSKGFRIIKASKRRDIYRIFMTPFIIVLHLIKYHHIKGTAFWDILGFAEYIYAEKL